MIDFEDAPGQGSGTQRGQLFGGYKAPEVSQEPPAWLANLNDKQREAVLCTEGPLIVIAGAGSGKTKMLTSRIAYLIETRRAAPYQILAVTFTNKAAAEMRERVEKTLGHAPQLATPEIGTFHSVCVRLLRREMAHTPFTKPFVIYDDSDQLSLVKAAQQKLGIDEKAFNPKAIQGAINRAKCDALEPHEIEPATHNIFERQFKRVYEQYQKDLFANNALDFGEIITLTYRLLRDNDAVRDKYQRRYRYLHVDEYQDTNRAQYLLLQELASAKRGGHKNICVVGDEDQSIYKWRGADIRNILDFEGEYPGASVVKLEQNYRSTQSIIKAAGHVIKNNRSRKDKTLWTDNEEGLPIVRAQVPDERQEAELVVSEIKRLAGDEGRAFDEFSIFYRTNAQSRQFEDVLRREKIPYQIVGGLRFYDRKEIKDVLSYFKVILNPSDSIGAKRIINVPARGIGKTTLDRLDEYQMERASENLTYWDVLQQAALDPSITSNAASKKIAVFVKLVERLIAEQPKLMLSELYHLILDETGYVRELRSEGTEEAMARVENLEEFDTLLQEFEEDFYARLQMERDRETGTKGAEFTEEERKAHVHELLPAFIEQSMLASDADIKDAKARGEIPQPAVKMMTLHSSKGLEFPVVFMVGMEEGLFPSIKPWEETPEEDIEEERRLCYVGMTRARERLYMLNAVMRRLWGNTTSQDPSRFFAEVPESLLTFKDFAPNASRMGRERFLDPNYQSTGYTPGRKPGGASRDTSDDDGFGAGPDSYDWEQKPAVQKRESTVLRRAATRPPQVYQAVVPNASGFVVGDQSEWVGRKIEHPEYGDGTIIAAEGNGDDRKLTVEFRGRERRKFIYKYVRSYLR